MQPVGNHPSVRSDASNPPEARVLYDFTRLGAGAIILMMLLALIGWSTMRSVELTVRERIVDGLDTVLATTHEALRLWFEQRRIATEDIAARSEVLELVRDLGELPRERETLRNSQALAEFRDFFRPILDRSLDIGVVLIAPDRVTLASMQDQNVGIRHFVANSRGSLLDRAFEGETILVPPILSGISLSAPTGELPPGYATMFVATPVRETDRSVAAVLAMRIDASELTRISRLGEIVDTGETYAFDDSGRLATTSRFEDQLIEIGLLEPGQSSVFAIEVRDPGGNLLEGFQPEVPYDDLPLTFMAEAVLRGESGSDVDEYRDYRGVEVLGAWVWDEELGIGITSEVELTEALLTYFESRNSLLWLLGVTFVLSIMASLAIGRMVISRREVKEMWLARELAEEASRIKSAFLANMSHEIRTPMNGVIGMTEVVLRSDLSPAQRESVETIRSSAVSLMELLNDILDTSKLESGHFELEAVPFDVQATLASTLRAVSSSAEARDNELIMDVAEDSPRFVVGDSLRIRQILTNLISNAAKFTQNGEIELKVERDGKIDGMPAIRFSVRDTGIGIPGEKLEHIFDEFSQADSSITRKYGGTGLGLAISKRLVDLMGGTLRVLSTEGQGSTFSFKIPLPPSQIGVDRSGIDGFQFQRIEQADQPLEILLAEDNVVNQRVAQAMLKDRGHRVDVVDNGAEAVDAVQKKTYNIVLMDIQMPVLDGYGATQRIRAIPHLADLPIIAVTAHAMTQDRAQALSAGMNNFLTKPFRPKDLFAVTEASAKVQSQVPDADPSTSPPAEDSTKPSTGVDMDQLRAEWEDAGVAPMMFESIETFVEHTSREMSRLKDTIDRDDRDSAAAIAHTLKSGAGSVQARRLSNIYRQIELACKKERSADIRQYYLEAAAEFDEVCAVFADARPTPETEVYRLEEGDGTRSSSQVLDLEALERDWGAVNLSSVIGEIVEGFMVEATEEIPALVEAAAVHDLERTALLAHRLRSPARTLHASTLADLLQEIEDASRGDKPEHVRRLAPRLTRSYAEVRNRLSEFVKGSSREPGREHPAANPLRPGQPSEGPSELDRLRFERSTEDWPCETAFRARLRSVSEE